MSDYVIRKGVPLPPRQWWRHRCDAAFLAMLPGDCMEIAPEAVPQMRAAFHYFQRKHPDWKFETRAIEGGGMGIWLMKRPVVKAPNQARPAAMETDHDSAEGINPIAQRLRDIARLQPTGKREAHVTK